MRLLQWPSQLWKDLAVAKKLYAVVGLMAILIASELFALVFAMNTLSSVRAFVVGEGLWTKSQKDAIHSLYQYALYGDKRHYREFENSLSIPNGDRMARLELMKSDFDHEIVRKGFIQGGNHPDDIDGMINLLLRFSKNQYIGKAIDAWTKADLELNELRAAAKGIHGLISGGGGTSAQIRRELERIARINNRLTELEIEFSSSLSAGSRWLENLLLMILATTVLTIEGTGLLLTFLFSRNLSRSLKEMRDTASEVGRGNFSLTAPVRSRDELGQMAQALNNMIQNLQANINVRRKTEEALRKSEERFRLIVEGVRDYAIYSVDPEGFVTTWNSGAEKIKGYAAEEIIGRNFATFYTPEDIERGVPEDELRIAKMVGRFETDSLRRRKDGTLFWANIVISALYDQKGELTGFAKITRDITELKESQLRLQKLNEELESRVEARAAELLRREHQLRQITDALPVMVAQFDAKEHLLFANQTYCEWLGHQKNEILGDSLRTLLGKDEYEHYRASIHKVLSGELATFERETRLKTETVNYRLTFVPELSDEGQVVGFILVATDVTKYKEIEAALRKARDQANTANATKSEFLANMSHEIRTPLGAILGFSELLLNDDMTKAERATGVEIIKRNGNLLSNVINDILDLSKVEAGKLEIERLETSLDTIIAEIGISLSLKASEKGVRFTVTRDGKLPATITTDPLRLRQILINIAGNAIKFTEKGYVDIAIRMEQEDDGKSILKFIVKDTGKGISPEQADKLFAPFSQADASTTRKFGGTGLGLILSKKLANSMGGDVVLKESQLDRGSTFVISIDPGITHEARERIVETSPDTAEKHDAIANIDFKLKDLKILVVDDSPDNQLIVTHFLRRSGVTTETANNGKDAVDKASSGDYDLVLMDLQMPVMDGYEALKELRNRGYNKPIVALTAHAMKEERQRCIDSGFNDHISKPIDRDRMLDVILHLS